MTKPNDPATGYAYGQAGDGEEMGCCDGLTKREYFAGEALKGVLAGWDHCPLNPHELDASAARVAVFWADRLIAELNKEQKP